MKVDSLLRDWSAVAMLHMMNLESVNCAVRGSILDVVAGDIKLLLYKVCVMLCIILGSVKLPLLSSCGCAERSHF